MDCSGSAAVNAMLVKKEEDKKRRKKKQWMDFKKGFENNAHNFPRENEL